MSREMPIVVSHYTKNTGYEKEVENLIASLEQWKLRYDIEAIDSLGSWRLNSNYCSENVLRMMMRYPHNDILRVDADARFQRFPSLFMTDAFSDEVDVAAHVHTFKWHENELLGGTLFFRNTHPVRFLVCEWVELCMKLRRGDRPGDLLQEMLEGKFKDKVRFGELPAQYCQIFDIMKDFPNPVIEHFQASRRFKKKVNVLGKGR
jgi:hypothetical protein